MKWLVIVCMSVTISLSLAGSVSAEENEGKWVNSNDYRPNAVVLAMDKFGRGLINTAFGVIEIPKQSVKRAIDTESAYGYPSGLFIGIGFFVLRELAGVYELVTFPVPLPSGYEPVIDPLMGYSPRVVLK
jgi:putative exosortase-associated protein (TIGR04073 family)